MGEVRFMISEAAKQVNVESHVLRYWEEELDLTIGRTEMGHRYYTKDDIQLFCCIKKLKNEGCLLYTSTKIVFNGEDALSTFETYEPNLILLDLMLPGIDGYQVSVSYTHLDVYKRQNSVSCSYIPSTLFSVVGM